MDITELDVWHEIHYVQKNRPGIQKEVVYGQEQAARETFKMILHPNSDHVDHKTMAPALYKCSVVREQLN